MISFKKVIILIIYMPTRSPEVSGLLFKEAWDYCHYSCTGSGLPFRM